MSQQRTPGAVGRFNLKHVDQLEADVANGLKERGVPEGDAWIYAGAVAEHLHDSADAMEVAGDMEASTALHRAAVAEAVNKVALEQRVVALDNGDIGEAVRRSVEWESYAAIHPASSRSSNMSLEP